MSSMVPLFFSSASSFIDSSGIISSITIDIWPNIGLTTVSVTFNRLYCLASMGSPCALKLSRE